MAAKSGDKSAEAALEELCQRYWHPIYAFIRRQGRSPQESEDLTQGFLAQLLRRDGLKNVAASKGKFRTFLLACLENLLRSEHERENTLKRRPVQPLLFLDAQEAEDRSRLEPPTAEDPAVLFDRRWALALLEGVLSELKTRCASKGQAERFDALRPFLIGDSEPGDYAASAARLGLSEGATRKAATDLRRTYRELLRRAVAETVETEAEVDEDQSWALNRAPGQQL